MKRKTSRQLRHDDVAFCCFGQGICNLSSDEKYAICSGVSVAYFDSNNHVNI